MAKSLVIVESPAKAKTINKYLGRDYTVKASLGHVKDLPKKVLGILLPGDLPRNGYGKSGRKRKGRAKIRVAAKDKNQAKENGKVREEDVLFEPTYEIIPGKTKVIAELRKAAKEAENIYLAGDPDREGEAICAHLAEVLGTNKKERSKIRRVLFNEITQKAIRAAFEKPGQIDNNLVDAQQARRVLDRLVGYKISPLLWDKVRRGLSAGRVQTVALRLIVDREHEIHAFVPEEYWTLHALLDAGAPPFFEAKLAKHKGQDIAIHSKEEADNVVAAVEGAKWLVAEVTQKEKRRNAPPPFTTSKLQQAAYNRLRYTAKRTMMLAQQLYEGVELGDEGAVGLITYMRTDSVRVSNDALSQVRGLIGERFGANYLPEKPNFFKSKKDAQEAHEAIRPSDVSRSPEDVRKYLEPDMFKLYQLIWQRFVASQMLPAIFDQTTIDVAAGDYTFRATGSVLKFNGYLAVYDVQTEVMDSAGREDEEKDKDDDAEAEGRTLPRVTQGQSLRLERIRPDQHFTEPPPRYTEATLVKELEEKGIGRPSTYATIISTIVEREYVGKDQGRFTPTMLGEKVSELLVKSFQDIFDVGFTARLEEELDEIEEGKLPWRRSVKDFWDRFEEDLDKAEGEMQSYKAGIPTGQKCEKCGQGELLERISRHGFFLGCSRYPECDYTKDLSPELGGEEVESENTIEYCHNCGKEMTIKRGRFGPFLACTGYPDCKTTRRLVHGTRKARQPDEPLDEKCPECGSHLVKKHGRYGEFIGCSGYPNCKYIRSKTLGIACPKCGAGEFVERMTRKGRRRIFYGCSRYPECDFTTPHKPIAEPCPKCGAPFIVEKRGRKRARKHGQEHGQEHGMTGAVRACLKEGCGWEMRLPETAPAPLVEDTVSAKL